MNRTTGEERLNKYIEGSATTEEKEEVEGWILNGADFGFDLTDEELLEDLISIRQRLDLHRQQRKMAVWRRFTVAASILLMAGLAMMIFRHNNQQPKTEVYAVTDKLAGKSLATLILSDGRKVLLDTAAKTTIKESGLEIVNDADGNITYVVKSSSTTDVSKAFNTITTPRGGIYSIILPDGSKVWLNAASSLRFPLAFNKSVRMVELTGEGYFEVAKSTNKFKVVANNATVEVLGTHFNVNSYADELSTDVTLLEGSVKVSSGNSTALLKPGEQGEISSQTFIRVKNNIDTASITAWKDGSFNFNNTDLKSIMRQIERWYDVDVDDTMIPDKKFNGTISRNVKLSEVLSMIELTSNLNFKIEGRSVTMK